MHRIDAAIRAARLSGPFQFSGNGRARAMSNSGTRGAGPRGFCESCPFLIAVLVAVPEYRVEHVVLSDARGTGQPRDTGQDLFEQV